MYVFCLLSRFSAGASALSGAIYSFPDIAIYSEYGVDTQDTLSGKLLVTSTFKEHPDRGRRKNRTPKIWSWNSVLVT